MKKLFLIVGVLIFAAMNLQLAQAAGPFDERSVLQGDAVEIRIPKYDWTGVEGSFEGKNVRFYEVEMEPKFDEEISRAEFLQMMFENYDFGHVDLEEAEDFPDVSEDNQYYQIIKKAAALDIIDGYQDGFFRPYETITRGQAAKILIEAFDMPEVLDEEIEFSDVPPNHVFHGHISKAIRTKLLRGYPDGLMRPDREINFSEAELVIERAAQPDEFTFLGPREYFRGFLGVHRLSTLGAKNLKLDLSRSEEKEVKNVAINVGQRNFPVIRFSMDASDTVLFGDKEQDNTWELIDGSKKNPIAEKLWEGHFVVPAKGELTLGFGDKLYINGDYSGSHFGHDYANTEGTEVYAANTGKVTLATYTPSYGNTIVIDHGMNIFSMYLHLSALKVTAGQDVKQGDLIGLMGSTGIATGSHLHFTMFVGDIIVDSEDWFEGKF